MLNNIMLGRFIPGQSIMHRLDPRAKLLACILFFLVIFMANSVVDYTVLIAVVVSLILLTQLNLSFFWRGIQPMLWLIIFTAFFQILFISSGDVWASLWVLNITSDGVVSAFFVTLRFILIISVSTLLSLTTNPLMIADAVESMLKPFERIGMPSHEIALILSIAMRFVPTILDETQTIMNAQRSRGVDFNEGNIMQRVKAVIPILIPLFASALRRAEDLANAMEARGYRGGDGRSKYRQLHWHLADTMLFVGLAGLAVVLYLI